MADTSVLSNNGDQPTEPEPDSRLSLPESTSLTEADLSRVPSPGTQRVLKAQTGKSYDDMVGPDADSADRYQTFVWIKLRRAHQGLRWDDCADIEIDIKDTAATVDPTRVVSAASLPSVGSGD